MVRDNNMDQLYFECFPAIRFTPGGNVASTRAIILSQAVINVLTEAPLARRATALASAAAAIDRLQQRVSPRAREGLVRSIRHGRRGVRVDGPSGRRKGRRSEAKRDGETLVQSGFAQTRSKRARYTVVPFYS